jgi:hypothetical protein
MTRRIAAALVVAALLGLSGCSSTPKTTAYGTPEEDISALPWNRPQRWEGQGALGGFMPQSQ